MMSEPRFGDVYRLFDPDRGEMVLMVIGPSLDRRFSNSPECMVILDNYNLGGKYSTGFHSQWSIFEDDSKWELVENE